MSQNPSPQLQNHPTLNISNLPGIVFSDSISQYLEKTGVQRSFVKLDVGSHLLLYRLMFVQHMLARAIMSSPLHPRVFTPHPFMVFFPSLSLAVSSSPYPHEPCDELI